MPSLSTREEEEEGEGEVVTGVDAAFFVGVSLRVARLPGVVLGSLVPFSNWTDLGDLAGLEAEEGVLGEEEVDLGASEGGE